MTETFVNMTDPLLYACLEDLREKLLITRSEAGVTVVEKAIEEIERLDIDLACANEEINRLNKVIESQLKTIQDCCKNNSLSLRKIEQ
jgi:predicted transcriptional regulator